ncbi:hypothetical protein [Hymenobacter crusticola]|uniref:Uncharacterized protein n=1 Tax=Hymenobacter crusticola TaxID=1770526 RepID=A0A243W692_9BACT|nr:hypothetical protein [Hymenobacter crusticola]OUJ69132.1 hypothetical protein BXP70_26985 [Hymenobacter crusticola]
MSELTKIYGQEQHQIAVQWLAITIERWRANLKKLKIGSTQELYQSFQGEVISAADTELKARLSYALWGMYVDMGVGRGMGAGVKKQDADYRRFRNDKGKLHRHVRKAKVWYSRQMSREQKALAELMSESTGRILIAAIADAAPKTIEINL